MTLRFRRCRPRPTWLPLALAVLLLVSSGSAGEPAAFGPDDWPAWRGPTGDGWAAAGQTPPTRWSATENVVWKARVSGRGHGSPIVVGQQVFLATADPLDETQAMLCFDRATGKLAWRKTVHTGKFLKGGNAKASHASSTPACDGERVFINFLNDGAARATALSRQGDILWQTKICDYVVHQGYGSSPAVHGALVIVSADNKGGGAVAGLDRATGEVAWRRARPKTPNYASPVILRAAGREQLVFTGCDLVTSLEPATGKTLWEIAGATTECVTSAVTDGERVFTTGGYPKNHVAAIMADGSGRVAWENNSRVYVPSLLARGGHVYAVLDAGVAVCWESATGKELWKGRAPGTFSASPVLAGDLVYAVNEAGKTYVFKAQPSAFALVAENQLGDEVLATPVICGGRIYARVAFREQGARQEWLYCLGAPAP